MKGNNMIDINIDLPSTLGRKILKGGYTDSERGCTALEGADVFDSFKYFHCIFFPLSTTLYFK